jgi:hypothetical protein
MICATLASLSLTLLTLTSGCARLADKPRLSVGYAARDHLFAVQLRDAAPTARGPSSGVHGFAARMGGNVCGTDIAYDAEYHGRFMSVTGFATNAHSKNDDVAIVPLTEHRTGCGDLSASGFAMGQGDSRPVTLAVRDVVEHGMSNRRVSGSVGDTGGAALTNPYGRSPQAHDVDLRFNREQLSGAVGLRRYELRRTGDDLVGYFMIYGNKVPFVVQGADELWSMPAAAQAAILPLLLTCTEETRVVQRVDFRN